MKILWFTWKDKKNPLAGGAEFINEAIAERLVRDGHELILLVGGFKDALPEEIINGYKVIRLGNRWTVYWHSFKYYKKNLIGWADLVIDEINTVPFGCKFYVKEKNILFIHQLCREIWFYQMFFPLNLIGYLIEPFYLKLFSDKKVITVSESSKQDLLKFGFNKENIKIISEGIELEPLDDLNAITKYEQPTLLALGAIKAMKRTDHIIRAFEIAKRKYPNLKLIIAGAIEGPYGKKFLSIIKRSKFKDSIEYLGKVSKDKKIELMQKSQSITVTSIKEGWGLIITEANSQGTPAIVYNVDGLRDAVKHEITGIVCGKNTPENLAKDILKLLVDEEKYQIYRLNAWQWSKKINFNNSYRDFINALNDFKIKI